jgi:hypothetical protein
MDDLGLGLRSGDRVRTEFSVFPRHSALGLTVILA